MRAFSSAFGVMLVTLLMSGAVPPEAPLADAAMSGDLGRIEALLGQGADVNAAQGDGMTALHWAAELGRPDIAERLLAAGADVSAVTRVGDYTPLHVAARGGHADITRSLLEAGASPNVHTSTGGATPLHFAAATSSEATVATLLEFGADVDAREHHWAQTALMFAASAGRLETVRTLLAAGAEVDAQSGVMDMRVRAAEDRAAGQIRDRIIADFRAEAGVGPDEAWAPTPEQVQFALDEARKLSEERVGESMRTLRAAFTPPQVQADNPTLDAGAELAETLVDEPGEDEYDNSYPALVGAQGGMTPLLHAVREGQPEIAFELIDAGADINLPSGGDNTSPLLMAAMNGHFDMMFELLERGADPNIASDAGTTPLFAVINTQWAPKARYPQQRAYLQQEATHHEVMRALLDDGADPNARLTKHLWFMEYTFSHLGIDMRGATPFWRATFALDVPAMRMLVDAGADPSIPTMKPPERRRYADATDQAARRDPSGLPPVPEGGPGVYPIHAATGHGYGTGYAGNSHIHAPDSWLPTVRYLVEELGADVNARDHDGYTPLHNAAARGDVEMLRYLVEQGADPMAVSRRGQTTVDMANGPIQRVQPFPAAMQYLESLGAQNNDRCLSC